MFNILEKILFRFYAGIALFYFHLSITLYSDDSNQQDELRKKALTILKDALRRLKGKLVSFLCGDAGIANYILKLSLTI